MSARRTAQSGREAAPRPQAVAGAERVINRKGSTWRALDDGRKAMVDKASGAATLICEQPSLVKRPVLRHNGALTIGFDADHYKTLFP